jgi:plasmid stabilization system protein ParE
MLRQVVSKNLGLREMSLRAKRSKPLMSTPPDCFVADAPHARHTHYDGLFGQYRLKYSPDALDKIGAIYRYVALEHSSPLAAADMVADIRDSINLLKTSPKLGALLTLRYANVPSALKNARFYIVGKFIVIYELEDASVRILQVYHSKQDYIRHLLSVY